MGRFHSEWNSTMISMRSPTARRIFSNGSSAALSSSVVIDRPSLRDGRGVEGPDLHGGDAGFEQALRHRVGAGHEAAEVLVGAGRGASRFQFDTGLMSFERT